MNCGMETVPIEVIELCLEWMGRSLTVVDLQRRLNARALPQGHAAAYQFAISGAANQFLSPSDVKSPSMSSQPYVKHYSNRLTKSQNSSAQKCARH
jgi:hypothetical protein